MSILGWLKQKIRNWLLEEESPTAIDVWIDGQLERVQPVQPIGLSLLVRRPTGVLLVGEGQAASKAQYWRTWRSLSDKKHRLVWEDGTEYKPWQE